MKSIIILWSCLGSFAILTEHAKCEVCTKAICTFDLVIRRARTMTYRHQATGYVYNVHMNGSKLQVSKNAFHVAKEHLGVIGKYLDASDVITADGFARNVITINDEFPGPTLEVLEGAEVVINVYNELKMEGVTIHWHGLPLKHNIWMDGVPYVTQCPIQPRQRFTYRLMAHPAGTHWYHSHFTNQRLDGLFGLFVIHKRPPVSPEFPLSVMDWFHADGTTLHVLNPYDMDRRGTGELHSHVSIRDFMVDNVELSAMTYVSALINGRGRPGPGSSLPLSQFRVTSGERYRFRVVHTGAEYILELTVDQHLLRILSSDGVDIKPVVAHTVYISPGESFDFEVIANQSPGKYWFRARTATFSRGRYSQAIDLFDGREVLAEVTYEGYESSTDPTSQAWNCSAKKPCVIVNCPFPNFPRYLNKTCITMANLKVNNITASARYEFGLDTDEKNIDEYFLNFGLLTGSNVNGRRFISPRAPLFEKDTMTDIVPCEPDECKTGCRCTHVLNIQYNRTVQLVLTSLHENFMDNTWHTIHFHGHQFAVVGVGHAQYNVSSGHWVAMNENIVCESALCDRPHWKASRPSVNLRDPPVKDTVLIPARGFVVIRFRADNPGHWLLHCHQELHVMEGMEMMVTVADDRIQDIPRDFPSCHHFSWSHSQFMNYIQAAKTLVQHDVSSRPTDATSTFVLKVAALAAFLLLVLCATLSTRCLHSNHIYNQNGYHLVKNQNGVGSAAGVNNNGTILHPQIVNNNYNIDFKTTEKEPHQEAFRKRIKTM